jgi:superoxide reductase
MTKLNEVYKCNVCGNIVEVVHEGAGTLVCCGEDMHLQEENTTDAAVEKHVPVFRKEENRITVNIGEVDHPMTEEHYIEWIEIVTESGAYKTFLKPGDKPSAELLVSEEVLSVRAYCNLHGLWKK